MRFRWSITRAGLLAAGAAALSAACSDSLTGPTDSLLLSREISVAELDQLLTEPARVEIVVGDNDLVARVVHVKSADERGGEEELVARVTDLVTDGDAGYIVVDLGGLEITFDVESRFGGLHGDEFGFEDFIASVEAFLAEGIRPFAQMERAPRDVPQDPMDPAFHAIRIRLTDDPVHRRVVMDLDARNVEYPETGPDAVLRVLGLGIELRVSDGTTELTVDEDERDEVGFEGVVVAVDLERGSFTLRNGIFIRVGGDTRMAIGDHAIESLEPIQRALESDLTVFAWGEGVLADADREVIHAIVVHFAIDDDDHEEEVVFEGVVREVDPVEGAIFLVEGPTILVTDDTQLKIGDEPIETLERIARALEEGLTVHVRGEGIVRSLDPHVIVARVVRFALEDDSGTDVVAFEDNVASVDLEAGTFTLLNGTIVVMTDETDIHPDSDLESLAGVAEALQNQLTVRAFGEGAVREEGDQRIIIARWVGFIVSD